MGSPWWVSAAIFIVGMAAIGVCLFITAIVASAVAAAKAGRRRWPPAWQQDRAASMRAEMAAWRERIAIDGRDEAEREAIQRGYDLLFTDMTVTLADVEDIAHRYYEEAQ